MATIEIGSIVKSSHPRTVLNPTEYFEVIAMRYDTVTKTCTVRGNETCWFGISMITLKEEFV